MDFSFLRPPKIIAASVAEYGRNLALVGALLTILLVLLSGIVAHYALQRRRAESRVQRSELQFRRLLESAPEAILLVDQAGQIALMNSQTEKWFGYNRR